MLNQTLHYLAMVFGAVLIIIAAGVVINVLVWLATTLYRQSLLFIAFTSELVIEGACHAGGYLKAFVVECLRLVFNAVLAVWMSVYQPCFLAARRMSRAVRQYVKLRQLFWKYGRQEFASFAKFKRHMLGEEEPQPKAKPEKPAPEKNAYAQALEVLGFSEGQPFDKAMLKARQRALAAVLHPDKKFPNQVFMQQVNDAVDYIMRAKKWK